MELRHYWQIVWRRWWLIAVLLAVVLIVSLVTYQQPARSTRPICALPLASRGRTGQRRLGEGRSDAWLASEYWPMTCRKCSRARHGRKVSERSALPYRQGHLAGASTASCR